MQDERLEQNFHESPVAGPVTEAPDSDKRTGPGKMLDAYHGLIQPTERVFLYGLLQAMSQPYIRALEIGTWKGGTMHLLRRACDELYCVDPEPQWTYNENFLTRSGKPVQLLSGNSPAILAKVPSPFTFVFVDGDHSAEGVYRDTLALEPLMEAGGVICFHDASHPPVQEGLHRAHLEWKRPFDFYERGCDTISRTPDGVFGGIAVMIVEAATFPDSEPAPYARALAESKTPAKSAQSGSLLQRFLGSR